MQKIVNRIANVGDLWELVAHPNVLRLTQVVVPTSSPEGNGSKSITVDSPTLRLDVQFRSTLANGTRVFDPETRIKSLSVVVVEPVGTRVFLDQWFYNGGNGPCGIRGSIPGKMLVSLPHKASQIEYQGRKLPQVIIEQLYDHHHLRMRKIALGRVRHLKE